MYRQILTNSNDTHHYVYILSLQAKAMVNICFGGSPVTQFHYTF